MRRLVAILLLVPLVHLNAVRADAACGKHDVAVKAPVPQGHDAHASHGMPSGEPQEDCDVPAQAECCQALASCGPALGCGDATFSIGDVRPVARGLTAADAMPSSAIAAPEPPPPRS